VPSGCTAVGVPARLTGCAGAKNPSQEMNQLIEDVSTDFQI
jgi:serine acetyltransferase